MVHPWANTQYVHHPQAYSGNSGNYAFLNHSSSTLPNNLPPNVDDKPLARQKRRRTSPEDQAILEAAYSQDPKPEKAARLELVKSVSLGEKEVQIWFQNRRQSSRRRSRPLLPHEIAQYQLSRSGIVRFPSSEPDTTALADDGIDQDANSTEHADRSDIQLDGEADTSELTIATSESDTATQTTSTASQASVKASLSASKSIPSLEIPLAQGAGPGSQKTCIDFEAPSRHLSHRRSEPSLRLAQSEIDRKLPSELVVNAQPSTSLKKASSFVRISMTCEGNAQIVTKDTSSPSPPRPLRSIQIVGTSSTTPSIAEKPDSTSTLFPQVKALQRSFSGRSRDSRAWEFWCDKDTRGELEEKAEKDASGSAADAIGLLRSKSGRSILGSIPLKRNSILGNTASSLKRSKLDGAIPTLHKSNTSMGRLQGKHPNLIDVANKPALLSKYSDSAGSVYIPGNESDKENMSPDSDTYSFESSELRRVASAQTQSNLAVLRRASRIAAHRVRDAGCSADDDENCDPEADPELAAFMGAARDNSSNVDEERDLDCIQGLLSLSQGNWR